MQLPQPLIKSLQGIKGFDEEAFIALHQSGEQVTSVRLNPAKVSSLKELAFNEDAKRVPWCSNGYYLSQRPSFTFDPLFHAGCYYVQEASSMFVEQALLQTIHTSLPLKVLDLCAAPGGKSTLLQSLISPESLLVSNDVIRSRANILKENIIKWGGSNVVVTNNDPKDFAKFSGYFDVIVIDAPCSGSGLFRRDENAVQEWSEDNVQLCCQRQQRILADALPALKEGGILIYSTCSFSPQENEEVVDWLVNEMGLQSLSIKTEADWGITDVLTENQNYCYRFWPDKVKGEGFFIAAFGKKVFEETAKLKSKNTIEKVSKKDIPVLEKWVNSTGFEFVKNGNTVYAWPGVHYNDMQLLLQNLRVIYSGTLMGELMRDKLIPDHALAMSLLVNDGVVKTNLNYDDAIAYLQRKDIAVSSKKGWQLACYNSYPLAWMNVLPSRVNNYYPKELRILKERSGL